MTKHSTDMQIDADKLAVERTFLAYERTLMAWTRTSVSLISFGFTLFKFFQYLVEQEPEKHADNILGPRTIGALIGFCVTGIHGSLHHHRSCQANARTDQT